MPPRIINAHFTFNITSPPNLQSPALGVFGTFSIFPDADMNIKFSGSVSLPPGTWEVGIIQNVWNDRVTMEYQQGGEIYISLDNFPPLLDLIPGATDIWFDQFGTGVVTLDNTSAGDKVFLFNLETGDTPTSPPVPGIQTRCNGTISENLVWAERALQFVAVIGARQNGQLFPLCATGGSTYGYMWRIEAPPSSTPFRYKPFFSTTVETSQPFSLLSPNGVNVRHPTAAETFGSLVLQAGASYLADCGIRPPRDGDANLYP